MLDLLDQIDSSLALRKVGIEEFCQSEKFCNKPLYPRQRLLLKLIFLEELTGKEEDILTYWINGGRGGNEILISPKIRERVEFLRDKGFPHFREIVLVGGRRSSKGFITGLALAKKMYDVLQLQDPGQYYGIDPDKEIYFSCIAASQDQAKKYQYADFFSAVGACQAMQNHITKMQELEFSVRTEADKRKLAQARAQHRKIGRDISKLRGAAHAANASTIRGSATIAVAMDEMAHMQQEGESAATAEQVYEAMIPSLAQFKRDALIFCCSSPYTKLGKFYERWEEGMSLNKEKEPSAPFVVTFQFPSWALFEGWQDDPEHRFRNCITVSPDWDPEETYPEDDAKLWHSQEDRDQILIEREEERQKPETYKVERRGKFAEVVDAYLIPEQVDRMFMGRPDANTPDSFQAFKTNWLDPNFMFRYKAHFDPSSTTAGFGFALGHIEVFENAEGRQSEHVVFDIIKRWQPQQFEDGVIDWEYVLTESYLWIKAFEPYEVTFDQFNSAAPIQWLNARLREDGKSHVRVYEKPATAQYNWNRAEIFRTALYQGLVHAPNDTGDTEWCALELKFLQQVNTAGRFPRVDKQDIGAVRTKDEADCVMEVVEALIGNVLAGQTRAGLGTLGSEFGGLGGFGIGGPGMTGHGQLPGNAQGYYQKRTGEQGRVGGTSARERLERLNAPARRISWAGRRRRYN